MTKLFTIFALKQAKREPWIKKNPKTGVEETIDDGVNRRISLFSNTTEDLADFFLANMKENHHGRAWKIWKEEVK